MTPDRAYEWLRANSIETAHIVSAVEVLAWDQRTFMPPGGGGHRFEQMAVMARLLHDRATDPRIGECLDALEGSALVADSRSVEAANAREWRRDFERSVRIPRRLATELARATSLCESRWEAARPKNDWDGFAPALAEVVSLVREKAQALGYRDEALDALIDEYEPGETAGSVAAMFQAIIGPLVDLVQRVGESPVAPRREILEGDFPIEAQRALSRELVSLIGYDLDAGRIDEAAHPFTIGIGPRDVRITTRYNERRLAAALFGSLHEAGHALYEQGLPAKHWGTPAGRVASLGIHESQSRLWENLVARSTGFWRYVLPIAARALPSLRAARLEDVVLAVNAVERSPIRVEADELTYNLHVIVRFELERALMRGELRVDELPGAWDEKMTSRLELKPGSVFDGAMQDVHWPAGLFGYFPTYTLGNLCAAQLYARAAEDIGDLEERFSRGDFAGLLAWLREAVHEVGGVLSPRDLLVQATGRDLNARFFLDYLVGKYSALYRL